MKRREMITLMGTAGFLTLPALVRGTAGTLEHVLPQAANNFPADHFFNWKTIGILGGLGPQATMDMEARLHRCAQLLLPPMQNSGYPPVVVHYYRHPPVLLNEKNIPVSPWQPDPRMLVVAKNLGMTADFIIIPSNGAHLFQKEIEQASGRRVLSMIDVTLAEIKKRNWKKAGVLGLMNPKVYTSRLQQMGIEFETIDESLQGELNQAIMKVMEGREDAEDRAVALQAIDILRSKNVDGIIPGCTEIPLLLGTHMEAADLLNPAELLAEQAIRFATGD